MTQSQPRALTIENAKLPAVYSAAKIALAQCERIDECKKWADKAQALASYAKQSKDDAMENMARRIKLRAIRRCGELLNEIPPAKNQHDVKKRAGAGVGPSKKYTGNAAGMSPRQRKTAQRMAAVPQSDFEAATERDKPASATELAKQGTKADMSHLKGRDPQEFSLSTEAQGELRRFVDMAAKVSSKIAVKGALEHEWSRMLQHAQRAAAWLDALIVILTKEIA